jgi:hypothetical protein
MKLIWPVLLITLAIFIIVAVLTTFYRHKENFYTYVNTPQVTGIFPTYAGSWTAGPGYPYLYWYPRGYAPYRYPYRFRYPFRRRRPFAPRYPYRYPRYLESFKVEPFVGADSERNHSCVTNDGRPFSGYPEHGFEPVCGLKFPRDNPGKLPTKLDIPMYTATKNARDYQIGAWVHLGKGFAADQIVDVYQFNIDPARDLYGYGVKTACGQFIELTFDINKYGLEDGYRFHVSELNKTFLLRKDPEFLYAWR